MKIAFFSNSYLPYLSGITVSIKTLKDALLELGHTVFVIGPKYPGDIESDHRILRLPSLPATYPGYRLVVPFSCRIFRILKKEKLDLIHAHQPFGVGLFALFCARRLNVPFVYTLHTLFPRYVHLAPFIPRALAKRVLSAYLQFFCRQADAVIVPSEMVRRWVVLMKTGKRIEVVPTGIKLEEIKQKVSARNYKLEIRVRHKIPRDGKVLLYTGRLSEEKNVLFLLQAFPFIRKQMTGAYLVLVGGGPKEKEYAALAKAIDPQIIFTGQKPHSEVLDYCLASDLFVYASTTETQGLVLTEAKACGLPVVAVFGGGISDVVENGTDGYLVSRDRAKFVEHVLRLLRDDTLREKMSARAGEDARERFSSIAVAKKMEAIYNSLISSRRFK